MCSLPWQTGHIFGLDLGSDGARLLARKRIISRLEQHIFGHIFLFLSLSFIAAALLLTFSEFGANWHWLRIYSIHSSGVCFETENCCILTTIGFSRQFCSPLQFRLNSGEWMYVVINISEAENHENVCDRLWLRLTHTHAHVSWQFLYVYV